MSDQTIYIDDNPTDLTRRLLASSPGSTVTFTLDELLQSADYAGTSYRGSRILTGVLAVYQMAARHTEPSVAAQIALRATQYREQFCGMECTGCRGKGYPPESHWRARQRYQGGKLCLRADPEEYPELPISCSSCAADGKECNIITENIGISDPYMWDSEDDFDTPYSPFDCDHEDDCESCTSSHPEHDTEPKEKERPVIEIPDLLRLAPTHTLAELDDYFEKNPWGFPASRQWGNDHETGKSWHDVFSLYTGAPFSQLGYYEDDDGERSTGWVDREIKERWVRELFGYFPGVIKEVEDEDEDVGSKLEVDSDEDEAQVEAQLQEGSPARGDTALKGLATTWSIVVPAYISSAPFPLDQTSQPRLDLPYDCPPDSRSPSPEPKSRFPNLSGSHSGPSGKGAGKKTAAAKKQTQGKAGGSGGYAGGGGVKGGNAHAKRKGKKDKGKGGRGGGGGGKKGKGRQSDHGWPKRET